MRYTNQVGQEGSRGSALITLMIIILLVSIAGASMVGFAKQQVYAVTKVRDYLKAQAYAEAGANEAYNALKTNWSQREFEPRTYGDGSYTMVVVESDDPTLVSIICTGTLGSVKSVVQLDVKNFGTGTPGEAPVTSPYYYGVFVNGYLDHNGTGTQTGNAQVNGYLVSSGGGGLLWGTAGEPIVVNVCGVNSKGDGATFNGGGTVYGEVKARKFKGTPSPATITVTTPDTLGMPDISAKLNEYYQIALDKGQVFTTAPSTISGGVPGNIRWYNIPGGITLQSADYVGTVICTGPITFIGTVRNTRVGNLPAIVSRDGSITVKGAHEVNGLVYAGGDILWSGAGTLVGTLMCGGNLTFNGTYGNLAYAYCPPGDEGSDGTSGDLAGVSGWQK